MNSQIQAPPEPSMALSQWSMRSLFIATAVIALWLGLWRWEEKLAMLFASIAVPSLALSWAERFFRLATIELLGKSLDLFMAGGAIIALVYCAPLLANNLANGFWGSAGLQLIFAPAFGASFGVLYGLLVMAFYGIAKSLVRW